MFALGLLCLCWTVMATKVIAMAVHFGFALWSFSVRRLLYGPQALFAELRNGRCDSDILALFFLLYFL